MITDDEATPPEPKDRVTLKSLRGICVTGSLVTADDWNDGYKAGIEAAAQECQEIADELQSRSDIEGLNMKPSILTAELCAKRIRALIPTDKEN